MRLQKAADRPAFPALSEEDWERQTAALYRHEKDRLVPDHDPNLLKALQSIDLSQPLPESWRQFEAPTRVPVLAIRGANSTLFSAETLDEMARRHPDLKAVTIEGQGHPPLLETADLPKTIASFLARAER
ncbi:MAG: hypothetical protein U5O39_02260 [Gammaproteobacteria bacterium]|nr:hypothetical protein [Gammaproteobacteria bacterium]